MYDTLLKIGDYLLKEIVPGFIIGIIVGLIMAYVHKKEKERELLNHKIDDLIKTKPKNLNVSNIKTYAGPLSGIIAIGFERDVILCPIYIINSSDVEESLESMLNKKFNDCLKPFYVGPGGFLLYFNVLYEHSSKERGDIYEELTKRFSLICNRRPNKPYPIKNMP